MHTDLLATSTAVQREKAVSRAVELLRKGDVVALPTETVYGLAADALNPVAVPKIFEVKERPRFDPLIVHLPDKQWLERVVKVGSRSRAQIKKLIAQFWPGPLTFVLDRQPIVPEIVTAGLETVAVRMSSHPVFAEIISAFGKPLAAPSANRFGRISPTTAQHVFDELSGRIPLIIDAGPTTHGIESTIIAVHDDKIGILRRGPVTAEQLAEFGEIDIVSARKNISAPGQLPSHYAPKTPLRLIDNAESFAPMKNLRVGLLAWNPIENAEHFVAVRHLSESQDLREAAANLFRCLRELDEPDLDLIVAERVPARGLGAAILDRLERASHDSDIQDTPE
ncbi:MAG TPA: L-threonylcarbamoyladenylate synthase [Candidatus Udaeobacter sp.]|jgi:L-threonylcarbamoyladenylate synthase|nr:L-threonylcarbamoyladenylate synthase [Candidatus Udaeobacter sp.]